MVKHLNMCLSFRFVMNEIFDSVNFAPIVFAAADFQSFLYAK
jgi:hypothetical protein